MKMYEKKVRPINAFLGSGQKKEEKEVEKWY